jgi:hypothetical protein
MPEESRIPSSLLRVVVLVVVLVAVVMLVWHGLDVGAAISVVAGCSLLAEEVCRLLSWLRSPRHSDRA